MKRGAFTTVLAAAAIALAMPVSAQDKGQAGARPNSGGGASSGSAVSRPSGGGGGSSSGGSMSTPSGSSSSDGAVARPRPSNEGGSSRGAFRSAPERRGEVAVPRTSREASASSDPRRVSAGTSASSPDAGGPQRAVPAYSRPRDGRPVNGVAVPRTAVPPVYNGGYYYNPYLRYGYYSNYYPYGYLWPGYGFGIGYFYDPWMWGYASPFAYGGYSGYGGGSYSGSYYGRGDHRDVGGIRLKVKPRNGQVYVDGYYVGEVDSFDGAFQKLNLEAGAHRIEIRAEGYAPEQFDVMVIPGETITYKGDLKSVQ